MDWPQRHLKPYWIRPIKHCGTKRFIARHATENEKSKRVKLKCGFVFTHYGEYTRYDNSEIFDASF